MQYSKTTINCAIFKKMLKAKINDVDEKRCFQHMTTDGFFTISEKVTFGS